MSDVPATPGPNAASEPLVTVGTITAIVTAGIGAAVAFGLDLKPDQTAAILAFIAVLAPLVVAVWGRAKVYSPATVRTLLTSARKRP